MGKDNAMGGRLGNVIKNSSLSFATNVLPSILRFFSRYIFVMCFGDALLGVNSLFSDVILLFSFAEMGVFTAVSFFLYKPIAEQDTEAIQSFLGLYRVLNRILIVLVTVVGLGFLPFLKYIKTPEPIPNLHVYYLIFLLQNILSYLFSYRTAYITSAQKAYQVSFITIIISIATEVLQILVTIIFRNFLLYLITYLVLQAIRVLWTNEYIRKHYPETIFKKSKPLDKETGLAFVKKTLSLFVMKISMVGVSQTDSIIVSTMVDVVLWGYASNYLAIKKMISLVLSSIASGMIPSLGNMTVVEEREKQLDTFNQYSFLNAWLCLNLFAGLVILVPPLIQLVFGAERLLDDLSCFLLFFNVLYFGLLEAISVLRDARGLYEKDKWLSLLSFVVNLVTSVVLVWLFGLPGVFAGTLIGTTVVYARPYMVMKEVYGENGWNYYRICIRTLLISVPVYLLLQFVIHPAIWAWQTNILGLIISGIVTVLVTNGLFILGNLKDENLRKCLDVAKGFVRKA